MAETSSLRVAYVSLGCRVNRVETDAIVAELLRAGCELADEGKADVVVVNTCAVTGEAEAKARKAVRHAASLPQRPLVLATGCVASLFASELEELGKRVVVEADKSQVARRALACLGLACQTGVTSVWERQEADDARTRGSVTPTGRTRPGIKVQDGCDLRCAYCIVWKARGPSRSVPAEEVLRLVRQSCAQGAREVMLTGINLGRYCTEGPGGTLRLPELLELVLEQTDVGRVRLGSIEPQDVDARLAEVIARSGGRVAPFLHMCLQSGCDATLARMGRVYDTALFAERMALVREAMPHMSFGTDLIVGFPGETEVEFEESLSFCRTARFSRMHVFRYSKRPGTPAASMPDQVAAADSAARAACARSLARDMRMAQALELVGTRDLVVVQDRGVGITGGLFDAVFDPSLAPDGLVPVRVASVRPDATLVCEAL